MRVCVLRVSVCVRESMCMLVGGVSGVGRKREYKNNTTVNVHNPPLASKTLHQGTGWALPAQWVTRVLHDEPPLPCRRDFTLLKKFRNSLALKGY